MEVRFSAEVAMKFCRRTSASMNEFVPRRLVGLIMSGVGDEQ